VSLVTRSISFLLYSNLFIGLCAFALALQVGFPAITAESVVGASFIFFSTVFEYNVHRFIALIRKQQLAEEPRFIWLYKHRVLFYIIFIISVLGSAVTFFLLPVASYIVILITIALTCLYNFPLIPTTNGRKRLRAIPHAKVVTIAVVWTISTYYLPASVLGIGFFEQPLIPLSRFLFVLAITIPFDIRDVEQDRRRGLKTLPLVFGVKRTYQIAIGILVIVMLLSLMIGNGYGWSLIITSAFVIPFIIHEGWKNHPFYYYGILDGTLLLAPVVDLLLTKYFIK
jgi:hypothetical protein